MPAGIVNVRAVPVSAPGKAGSGEPSGSGPGSRSGSQTPGGDPTAPESEQDPASQTLTLPDGVLVDVLA